MFALIRTISTFLTMGTGERIAGNSIESIKENSNNLLVQFSESVNPELYSRIDEYDEGRINDTLERIRINSILNTNRVSDDIKEGFKENYQDFLDSENNSYFTIDEFYDTPISDYGSYQDSLAFQFIDSIQSADRYADYGVIDDIEIEASNVTSEGTSLEQTDIDSSQVDEDNDDKEDSDIPLIPLIQGHDNSRLEVRINSEIDQHFFLGFDFTPDTCMSFYNIVSNWLNKKIRLDGMDDSISYAWEELVYLLEIGAYTSQLFNFVMVILRQFLNSLRVFFTQTGALGIIVGVIIGFTLIAVIVLLCKLYCAGSRGSGYRIGTLFYSLFNWEFINEEYTE